MLTLLCHRGALEPRARPTHFYRVDVTYNLFGEYTVVREWGRVGARGASTNVWYANLRDAILDADRACHRAKARGYALTETMVAA